MIAAHEQVDILVVDDRYDNIVALEAILDQPGQHVVRARSGREALRHILRQEFAVILLDINMPGLDGFETAQLIREHRSSENTPIIFLTALGDAVYVERCYSLRAVDYILTPVIPEVLRTKVGVFVELFRKTAEVQFQARALRRRALQLQRLNSASLVINAAPSLDVMLREITDRARDIIEAHVAVTRVTLGPPDERPRTATSFSGGYASCQDQRGAGPTSLDRPGAAPTGILEDPSRPPGRGFLMAPLTPSHGHSMGFIELWDKVEGDFDEDDQALLMQLAQLGSIAIQNCLNAEAREANRLKDEFLATLSHELRTPLTAILGWTRLLRVSNPDPLKLSQGLEVIERNVHTQTRMVEDLLDVSRITTGKMLLTTRRLDLAPIIEGVLETLRPAAEAKGIRVWTALDGVVDVVQGDPDRMQQVVSNLLGNAIKFTPKGGRIDVRLEGDKADIELRVSDSGEGISPEFLPLLFERFRQADSSIRRRHGGLGIGLALVRHIVELHGGTVSAESPGQGQGAVFIVRLPVVAAAPPRAVATSASPPPADPAEERRRFLDVT